VRWRNNSPCGRCRQSELALFARRTCSNAHPKALEELSMIVSHLIEREYKSDIHQSFGFADQLVELAKLFRQRLTSLVANWLRVGYCQGNFNSDNCAAGGFTLDYGPFGFCEKFDPWFQPWTGGGKHFSFFNQPIAAEANYYLSASDYSKIIIATSWKSKALVDNRGASETGVYGAIAQ
jgi:uncharacterized protein YdiU (UPF0061 family)